MRARYAGVSEKIGPKLCWKLVNDNTREIICRSTIQLAIKTGATNLETDSLEPKPNPTEDEGLSQQILAMIILINLCHWQTLIRPTSV